MEKKTNVPAIIALVAGVVAVIIGIFGWTSARVFVVVIGIVLGIVGIVCGAIGMKKAKEFGSGKGLAIAGLICGIIGTVFTLIALPCACAAQKLVEVAESGDLDGLGDAINDALGDVLSTIGG